MNLLLLPGLVAGLGVTSGGLIAQTFTTLHSFVSSEGTIPYAGLMTNSSGKTLYGTTRFGGSGGGTVFSMNRDGTDFKTLHSFAALGPFPTNSDGGDPRASLILSGNTLYGTTFYGGPSGNGTLFKVDTDGAGFTNLHFFSGGSDGGHSSASLVLSDNALYGVATSGGDSGQGGIFKLNTDGSGFTNLHSFSSLEGAVPMAGLIVSDNTLYGTISQGGAGNGSVFKIRIDGTGFTNLHTFTPGSGSFPHLINSDGAYPDAGLVLSGGTLYGTTVFGGDSGNGTIYALSTNGANFTNLHSFTETAMSSAFTNSDGANPIAGLLLSGDTLYGTANSGGSSGLGTIFALRTDGTGFTTLHTFERSDGANPHAELRLSGDTLYGTTGSGGTADSGTVFSISFAPQLTITFSGQYPVLSWPIKSAGFSYAGYSLQYTKGTDSGAVWTDLNYVPMIVNGQFSATVPPSLFLGQSSASFRLKQ